MTQQTPRFYFDSQIDILREVNYTKLIKPCKTRIYFLFVMQLLFQNGQIDSSFLRLGSVLFTG